MTWHYLNALCSLGLVAESSAEDSLDGGPSVPSRSKSTRARSSSKDSETDCSSPSQSGTTSRPSTGDPGLDLWISSLVASRARTSPALERARASRENGQASGEKWPVSWVRYDRDTCSWRTRQYSLLGGLDEFSGTWPRWGTMRAGECWALDMPEHLTEETGSGSWLATPTATANQLSPSMAKHPGCLAWWPTPSAGLHNLTEDPASFLDRQERWKETYSNSVPLTVAVKLVSPGAKPAGSFGASGAYATGRSADAQESMTEMSSTAR